jgi:hypothetical protein
MSKEQYVTYETAELLKERGFDWKCNRYYLERASDNEPLLCPGSIMYGEDYNKRLQRDDLSVHINVSSGKISAPTQQMAMRWLREENGIHISADIYKDSSNDADGNVVDEWTYWAWTFYWLPSGNIGDEEGYDQFDSYEDAVEAALEYALKNLI